MAQDQFQESRMKLHHLLKQISNNVYFQPPHGSESQHLVYPCIIYKRDFVRSQSADNIAYLNKYRYLITVIDRNPDSNLIAPVMNLQHSAYLRGFTKDNLNHDLFTIYI